MQTLPDQIVYQQIEILASDYPWDQIDLWLRRAPEGIYTFTFYTPDHKSGMPFVFGHGSTIEEAAADFRKQAGDRDPEKGRLRKIQELEREIAKLKIKSFLLPPYRAPGQIGYGEPVRDEAKPEAPRFVNIEATKEVL